MTIQYNGEQGQTQHGCWRTHSSFCSRNSRRTTPGSATLVASPTTHLQRLSVAHDTQCNCTTTQTKCNKIQMHPRHAPAENTMLKHKLKFRDTYFLLPNWANGTSNYERCQHFFCRPRDKSPIAIRVSNVFDEYSQNSILASTLHRLLQCRITCTPLPSRSGR